jgi:hypothetical protein
MKKGEFLEKSQVWEVRANGLPRLLIEAANQASAEAIYRERFKIWRKDIVWVEMKCQHQPSELERRSTK